MISLYLCLLSRLSFPSPFSLSLFPIYLCPLCVYHVVSVFAHTSIIFYSPLLFSSSSLASSYLLAPPSHDEGFAGASLRRHFPSRAAGSHQSSKSHHLSPSLSSLLPNSRFRRVWAIPLSFASSQSLFLHETPVYTSIPFPRVSLSF